MRMQTEIRSIDLSDDEDNIKLYLQEFINFMNEKAEELGMKCTRFSNAHGLNNPHSFSTCVDVLAMTEYAMKMQEFRKIVSTMHYVGNFKYQRKGKVYCG